ncbi:SDR family NAD(P)-dependent oxidoreductase [Rhodococcoides yunnanense]|jgi:short-subunit dehydrogenase|uniref:SDR family NAD(P)-dependent oxidoreductase n=1 Tax=Rhodococcoides yunnanense TaxID=278209 RepID=UPI0022B1C55C|nr:SDR family oxidoreductase [Rhodococcus yunnanensis]MCZ4276013.1 SDR family oxidoreductase [Rhodococcus yunnanensis]
MSLPRPAPDRTAVVTGASSGIGAEIARELAARGHGVTLVARRAEKLTALAEELSARGVRAEVLPADLSERSDRAELLGRIEALGLVPDVLVNNAGLSTVGPVASSDPEAEMNMIEVDVVAVADLCSRFLPGMTARRRGAILNVASTAAFQPLPGQAGYGAGKAFVLSYTQSLVGELRGTGVSATALCPGPVDTGFAEAAGFSVDDAEAALPSVMWISPQEVAKTAVNGLAKGSMVAIPGMANRITSVFAAVTPRTLLVPMLARIHPGLRK